MDGIPSMRGGINLSILENFGAKIFLSFSNFMPRLLVCRSIASLNKFFLVSKYDMSAESL